MERLREGITERNIKTERKKKTHTQNERWIEGNVIYCAYNHVLCGLARSEDAT